MPVFVRSTACFNSFFGERKHPRVFSSETSFARLDPPDTCSSNTSTSTSILLSPSFQNRSFLVLQPSPAEQNPLSFFIATDNVCSTSCSSQAAALVMCRNWDYNKLYQWKKENTTQNEEDIMHCFWSFLVCAMTVNMKRMGMPSGATGVEKKKMMSKCKGRIIDIALSWSNNCSAVLIHWKS